MPFVQICFFPPIQVEKLGTSFTEAPKCATVALRSPSSPTRRISDFLASSRGPNLKKPFVSHYPRSEALKKPSCHSNQTLNYSEFQTSNPFASIFIGFSNWRKDFPSRVPKIPEWNSGECLALKSGLRGLRVPDSKFDSTKELLCMWA
ncbi:hypothetical protein AVEN_280-1 [Araneus ventricosus]|uniref:Uncharacterized protein n=1 Tax=Araneus ventricosus TaxID=182803 RepID=A0A4Y2CPH1_ARAVE|nr:hypothetical protein AVEN_280-1 [Araneus ventricosus]